MFCALLVFITFLGCRVRVTVTVSVLWLGFFVTVRVRVSVTGSGSYLNNNFVFFLPFVLPSGECYYKLRRTLSARRPHSTTAHAHQDRLCHRSVQSCDMRVCISGGSLAF